MIKEISKSDRAVTIPLDEKKCATMKTTIALIQSKLRTMFGMQALNEDNYGVSAEELKDPVTYEIKEESQSSEEVDDEEDSDHDQAILQSQEMDVDAGPENNRISSNFVSSMQEPSFCIESSYRPSDAHPNDLTLQMNHYYPENRPSLEDNFNKKISLKPGHYQETHS